MTTIYKEEDCPKCGKMLLHVMDEEGVYYYCEHCNHIKIYEWKEKHCDDTKRPCKEN